MKIGHNRKGDRHERHTDIRGMVGGTHPRTERGRMARRFMVRVMGAVRHHRGIHHRTQGQQQRGKPNRRPLHAA